MGVWGKEGGPGSAPTPHYTHAFETLDFWGLGFLACYFRPHRPLRLCSFLALPALPSVISAPMGGGCSPDLPTQAELQSLPTFSDLAEPLWPSCQFSTESKI